MPYSPTHVSDNVEGVLKYLFEGVILVDLDAEVLERVEPLSSNLHVHATPTLAD